MKFKAYESKLNLFDGSRFYLSKMTTPVFDPALVAVSYAAKKRHTPLPPPQPLGILSWLNWKMRRNKLYLRYCKGISVLKKFEKIEVDLVNIYVVGHFCEDLNLI